MATRRPRRRPTVLDRDYADPRDLLEQATQRMSEEQLRCYAMRAHAWTETLTAWIDPDTGHRFIKRRCVNGCRRIRVSEYGRGFRQHKYEDAVEEEYQDYGVRGVGRIGADAREELLLFEVDRVVAQYEEPKGKRATSVTSLSATRRRRSRKKAT